MQGSAERYRIRGLLGRGGMAEVFEAHAVAAGGVARRVAIKRLLPGHEADPAGARMFLDEARIASHLHHGAIVGLLDYGVLDGQPFQVLELVDGLDASSLRRLGESAGAPMPAEMAVHLAAEVALALHYAHHATGESGEPLAVVHRDVKPSNILVSWNGDVKLGDFGIASALGRAERTLDGGVKGTPAYMGPEQLRGDALDGRADIFALGCALHALLAGSSPLAQQANVRRLLNGEELSLAPDIGVEEGAIIGRAVQVFPADRYPTAGAMAEALGALLARRIARSPRSILLDWLTRVRPHVPPRVSPRARLDGLLGLDLQPDPTRQDERRFVTRTVQARGNVTLPPQDATHRDVTPPENAAGSLDGEGSPEVDLVPNAAPVPHAAPTPEAPSALATPSPPHTPAAAAPPPRRWPLVGALAGVVASALVLLGGRSLLQPAAEQPPSAASGTTATTAAVGHDVATAPSAVPAPGIPSASAALLPTPASTIQAAAGGTTAPLPGAAPAVHVTGNDSASPTPPAPPAGAPTSTAAALAEPPIAPPAATTTAATAAAAAAPDAAAAPTTGVVVIRGPGSVGAEIRVDGASHGFAPKRIELPLGSHSVVLVLRDGTRLGPRGMAVTARNTRSAPLAWDVAAP